MLAIVLVGLNLSLAMGESAVQEVKEPVRRAVDLAVGETADVTLSTGETVRVRLLEVKETTDILQDAVIAAKAKVRIDGQEVWVPSAVYSLPLTVGKVQVDCPITKGYYRKSGHDSWGLEKDARLRFWPAGSPLLEPGSFLYPARQRWFASMTQMANEPCYVDGVDVGRASIYYHNGLDLGGAEGLLEIVAAADGVIVAKGKEMSPDVPVAQYDARTERVLIRDERGWLHYYCHLQSFAPGIELGARVRQGQPLGVLGKEGDSGGWSHLHYGIFARQPSGTWGTEEGYAYLMEAYRREQDPAVLAVARPHHVIRAGENTVLDGSRSWSRDGKLTYQWTFSDGTTAEGAQVTRAYPKPGMYSEILKVTDGSGNVGYDFAVVQVYDTAHEKMPVSIHAAYAPTLGVKAGAPVTFLVRLFGTTDGTAVWDFGDASAPVTVKCNPVKPEGSDALVPDGYAKTVHRFEQAGRYLVRVEHTEGDVKSTARVEVEVGKVKP